MVTAHSSQAAENTTAGIIHSTISIPLDKLVPWDGNARKTHDKAALEQLKASILALGLLQGPVVTPADDGKYYVVAGERRRIALLALRKEGKLPEAYHVTCQLSGGTNGSEMSLAENVVRQAMHPADEFEAFNRLATEDKLPTSKIAERFGVSERHVLQRLKLARVHPQLLKDYRAGKLGLECLMAFTVTDDRARQLKLFKGLKGWQKDDARHIKGCLTEKTLSSTHPTVKFVGIDVYREAGGTMREDLFGEEVFLETPEIIQRLATAKLDAAIEEAKKEGWAWVERTPEDYTYRYQCSRITAKKGGRYDAEEMKLAGCFVSVSREGKLEVDRGVLGKLWSARRGNAKKGDLVKELDNAFAEPKTHAAGKDAQEKLRTWLPDGMAFTLPEKAAAKPKKKAA